MTHLQELTVESALRMAEEARDKGDFETVRRARALARAAAGVTDAPPIVGVLDACGCVHVAASIEAANQLALNADRTY